jgi:hypothetical protein
MARLFDQVINFLDEDKSPTNQDVPREISEISPITSEEVDIVDTEDPFTGIKRDPSFVRRNVPAEALQPDEDLVAEMEKVDRDKLRLALNPFATKLSKQDLFPSASNQIKKGDVRFGQFSVPIFAASKLFPINAFEARSNAMLQAAARLREDSATQLNASFQKPKIRQKDFVDAGLRDLDVIINETVAKHGKRNAYRLLRDKNSGSEASRRFWGTIEKYNALANEIDTRHARATELLKQDADPKNELTLDPTSKKILQNYIIGSGMFKDGEMDVDTFAKIDEHLDIGLNYGSVLQKYSDFFKERIEKTYDPKIHGESFDTYFSKTVQEITDEDLRQAAELVYASQPDAMNKTLAPGISPMAITPEVKTQMIDQIQKDLRLRFPGKEEVDIKFTPGKFKTPERIEKEEKAKKRGKGEKEVPISKSTDQTINLGIGVPGFEGEITARTDLWDLSANPLEVEEGTFREYDVKTGQLSTPVGAKGKKIVEIRDIFLDSVEPEFKANLPEDIKSKDKVRIVTYQLPKFETQIKRDKKGIETSRKRVEVEPETKFALYDDIKGPIEEKYILEGINDPDAATQKPTKEAEVLTGNIDPSKLVKGKAYQVGDRVGVWDGTNLVPQ